MVASNDKPLTVKEMASKGGKARAKKLTKEQRSEIGKKGAEARWGKKKKPRKEK